MRTSQLPNAWRRVSRLASSYRTRLAVGYVVVVGLVALTWVWSMYGPLSTAIADQQQQSLTSVARAAAIALEHDATTPVGLARRLSSDTGLRVTVIGSDGKVLADSAENPASMENHASRPEVAAALRGQVGADTRTSRTQGVAQMYVAVPVQLSGQRAALRVSEPVSTLDALAFAARRSGLALLALAIALSFGLTIWLTVRAARPVERLVRSAQAMADGDLLAQVPAGQGELAMLSEALTQLRDQMRDRLANLESEDAMLRTVLDGLHDAVFLFSDDRLTLANRAAGTLFGVPLRKGAELRPEDIPWPASIGKRVRQLLATPHTAVEQVGPDPLARYFRLVVVPLERGTSGSRTLVVIEDTTDLGRLDAVRRDFVANASHELKTPASAIQLLADSAASAAADGDSDQAMTFVEQMRTEAQRLRRLVLDLLDLSRLEATDLSESVTDVREAVSRALAGHRPAANAANLELEVDEQAVADQDVFVAVPSTDLAIALDNLLANAVTYTEQGSVTVKVTADASTVSISVTDTGIGIPPEHLGRVFERFYRVDSARSRESGGTGLGLALVKHIAERCGGLVAIDSKVGSGTTATLRLPRAR